MTLSGFVDGYYTFDCNGLNQEYDVRCRTKVAEHELLDGTVIYNACKWSGPMCGYCEPWVALMSEVQVWYDGTDLYVEVIGCGDSDSGSMGYLYKASSVSNDCANWSSVALSFVGVYGDSYYSADSYMCDGSASSASITTKSAEACAPHDPCSCQSPCPDCNGLCGWTTPCCLIIHLSGFSEPYDGLNGEHHLKHAAGCDDSLFTESVFPMLPGTADLCCMWMACIDRVDDTWDRIAFWYAAEYIEGEAGQPSFWYFARVVRIWDSTHPDTFMNWGDDVGGMFSIEVGQDPWPQCWEKLNCTLNTDLTASGSVPAGAGGYCYPSGDDCDCETNCPPPDTTCLGVCIDGSLPSAILVDIEGADGWPDNTWPIITGCWKSHDHNCDQLNGSFLLAQQNEGCCYQLMFDEPFYICEGQHYKTQIWGMIAWLYNYAGVATLGVWWIETEWDNTPTVEQKCWLRPGSSIDAPWLGTCNSQIIGSVAVPGAINCNEFEDLEFTRWENFGSHSSCFSYCDLSASTMKATAIP